MKFALYRSQHLWLKIMSHFSMIKWNWCTHSGVGVLGSEVNSKVENVCRVFPEVIHRIECPRFSKFMK